MRVTYTASREIMSGHSSGTQYDFIFSFISSDAKANPIKDSSIALDGSTVTTYWRTDNIWNITTKAYQRGTSDYNQMIEFLNSVIGGETFTLDEYGTVPSPDTPITCILEGGFDRSRLEFTTYFTFSFSIRQIA